MDIRKIATREEAVDVLNGASLGTLQDLERRVNRRPFVKTYMFEHGGGREFLSRNFQRAGITLEPIDDTFFRVRDAGSRSYRGFLELLTDRHPVLYTTLKVNEIDPWVKSLVVRNPNLDRLWLSGPIFDQLWSWVTRSTPPNRFGRIVFQHENPFDVAPSTALPSTTDTRDEDSDDADDSGEFVERRKTRFQVADRIGMLQQILPPMRAIYAPLYAVAQLRLPGATAGGHDFYYDGKVTNRTDSFTEHRLQVQYVLDVYRRATSTTELAAWTGVQETEIGDEQRLGWKLGAPVELIFNEPLRPDVFNRFVESVFVNHHREFGLWGNPLRLGPTKVHVYALDRHVSQQLFFEIMERSILVVLPSGTCGNSIHRLVTNVQQFLDPGVRACVGNSRYEDLIEADPAVVAGDSDRD